MVDKLGFEKMLAQGREKFAGVVWKNGSERVPSIPLHGSFVSLLSCRRGVTEEGYTVP